MNILLVDDHMMTLEGYASMLHHPNYKFSLCLNCEQVYNWIVQGNVPDAALIDHDLPPFESQKLFTGADCSLLIRKYAPNCKVFLITGHVEAVVLYNIFKKCRPDALISKIDFTKEGIQSLVDNQVQLPYLSSRVKNAIKEVILMETLLDSTNREILIYLSQGFKINDLSEIVPLSNSAIQKRVSKMLHDFNVPDYQALILAAKKRHLL